MRYWHGGVTGLRVGDLIEPSPPHVVDGCPICAARANGKVVEIDGHAIDPPTGRPDRVYVTADREYARFYASRWFRGDLYTVTPEGDIVIEAERRG